MDVALDDQGRPKEGRFDYLNLRCGGTYSFVGVNAQQEVVLQQNMSSGRCVRGCQLLVKPDWSGYREVCKGEVTGSGALTGGERLSKVRADASLAAAPSPGSSVTGAAATAPPADARLATPPARPGLMLSPHLDSPLPAPSGRYAAALLHGFEQKLHPGALSVDFDPLLSTVASCAPTSPDATVWVDDKKLTLRTPQAGPYLLPCNAVAVAPNRSFVGVSYASRTSSVPHSVAVFALVRESGQVKAQLVQWVPGASTVDFSADARRVLYGSAHVDANKSGNFLLVTDLAEGTVVTNRGTSDPLKRYQHNPPDVRAAYFTPYGQGAVVLLNQHAGIDYRWFDLDPETGGLWGSRPYSTRQNSYRAAISHDRSTVANTADGGRFNVYALKDGDGPKSLGSFIMPPGGVSFGDRSADGVAVSGTGRMVAICRDTATAAQLTLWSVASRKTTGEREVPGAQCAKLGERSFRFSPDDKHLLVGQRAGGLQWVPTPGIVDSGFDQMATLVDSGDMAAIKRAYDSAKTPDQKKLIEALLLKKHADRLVTIKHTARGLGAQAFGSSGTGLAAELRTLIAGYKVGAEAETQVDYTLRIDPKVLKVDHVYTFTADAVLVASGEGYYETNCMWPLPTKCKKPMNTQEFRTRISGELERNNPVSGSTVIKWVPKYESRTGGGLEKFFNASSVEVRIVKLNLEVKE